VLFRRRLFGWKCSRQSSVSSSVGVPPGADLYPQNPSKFRLYSRQDVNNRTRRREKPSSTISCCAWQENGRTNHLSGSPTFVSLHAKQLGSELRHRDTQRRRGGGHPTPAAQSNFLLQPMSWTPRMSLDCAGVALGADACEVHVHIVGIRGHRFGRQGLSLWLC